MSPGEIPASGRRGRSACKRYIRSSSSAECEHLLGAELLYGILIRINAPQRRGAGSLVLECQPSLSFLFLSQEDAGERATAKHEVMFRIRRTEP
jgi:hypothetical protein